MYATCLVCNAALSANEAIEHFPVGQRLAYDVATGRLWVVCKTCARWNLSPHLSVFGASAMGLGMGMNVLAQVKSGVDGWKRSRRIATNVRDKNGELMRLTESNAREVTLMSTARLAN